MNDTLPVSSLESVPESRVPPDLSHIILRMSRDGLGNGARAALKLLPRHRQDELLQRVRGKCVANPAAYTNTAVQEIQANEER